MNELGCCILYNRTATIGKKVQETVTSGSSTNLFHQRLELHNPNPNPAPAMNYYGLCIGRIIYFPLHFYGLVTEYN